MALPTVTALIHQAMAENYPGVTIAQLEREGRRRNYVQQWCDESATIELPPQHETIYALAKLLKVRSGDLYLAFLKDCTGLDDDSQQWETGLSSDHREIISLYEGTPPAQRHMLIGVMRLFAAGFPPSPSSADGTSAAADGRAPVRPPIPAVSPPSLTQSNHSGSRSASSPHPDAVAS